MFLIPERAGTQEELPEAGSTAWAPVQRQEKAEQKQSHFPLLPPSQLRLVPLLGPSAYCLQVFWGCPTLSDPMDCSMPVTLSFTISWSLLKLINSLETDLPFCCIQEPGLAQGMKVKVKVLVASAMSNSFVTPMDCNPPGSSVHGIFQARILVCVAISFSKGSSPPRDQTLVSCISGATREAQGMLWNKHIGLSPMVRRLAFNIDFVSWSSHDFHWDS